jgi:hypothetical protein
VLAVLSWKTCLGNPVPGSHVLAVLFCLLFSTCPVLPVLFCPSGSACPVLPFQFLPILSNPFGSCLAVLS